MISKKHSLIRRSLRHKKRAEKIRRVIRGFKTKYFQSMVKTANPEELLINRECRSYELGRVNPEQDACGKLTLPSLFSTIWLRPKAALCYTSITIGISNNNRVL